MRVYQRAGAESIKREKREKAKPAKQPPPLCTPVGSTDNLFPRMKTDASKEKPLQICCPDAPRSCVYVWFQIVLPALAVRYLMLCMRYTVTSPPPLSSYEKVEKKSKRRSLNIRERSVTACPLRLASKLRQPVETLCHFWLLLHYPRVMLDSASPDVSHVNLVRCSRLSR